MAKLRTRIASVTLGILTLAAAHARGADWKPINAADLALKAPKVEPDAHAEVLLWEVHVSDSMTADLEPMTTFEHYVRLKIFTDRGRESYATVDIPYLARMDVRDVAARTTRPDGTSVELKSSDVFRRTVVKAADVKIKAVSFAVPAIQTGAIVEYQWREIYRDSLANYLRLPFSREIPVQMTRYYLRPLAVPGLNLKMMARGFNGKFSPPERQKDGSSLITMANVPADREEPYTIPEYERRPWMFVYYEFRDAGPGPEFWQRFSKELFREYSDRSKPNDEIRKLAASAAPAGASESERILALVKLVRQHVKRVDVDTADPAERRAAKANKNAADAIKRGAGTGDDLVVAFLALAKAAGLDARVAAVPDRSEQFHKAGDDNEFFVRGRIVAIANGTSWIFLDVANEHSVTGDLRWYFESQEALIGDAKQVISARTPLSPTTRSVKRRTATLRLTEDGSLEGDCRLELSGHWAETFREQEDQDSPAEREKSLRDLIVHRLPGAEVSAIAIENITAPERPYVNTYHIRVPSYAQRTGSRLFLQPAFFEKGIGAVFTTETRTSNLYFPFPWSEEDVVTIELPAGFSFEQPEIPAPLDVGAGTYSVAISTGDGWKHLTLRRAMSFGQNDQILFPQTAYPAVKRFFDAVHAADSHTLVLRPAAGSPAK